MKIAIGIRIAFLSLLGLVSAPALSQPDELKPDEARQIASEAYAYFYPLVLMDITRRVATHTDTGTGSSQGVMNRFTNMRAFPGGDFRAVVRPNFDTLYSSAWLDLTEGPVIVSAPDTQGRYYMLPMLDMWTDVIAVPGKRTSGTAPARFAVTGPGWQGELPDGVTRIRSPTPYVWIIGRTQTNGPKDYAAVNKVQDGFSVTRLAARSETSGAIKAAVDRDVDMAIPPLWQVDNMPAKDYFAYAAELMKLHPPHVTDGSILLRMKRLGLEPGESFDLDDLRPEIRQSVTDGARQALNAMQAMARSPRNAHNGWVSYTRGIGVYGNEYLFRALVAMGGLGANPPEDAIYPVNVADADGKPMAGGQRYVMHFDKDQIPPVDAFWSLTLYDGDGFPMPNAAKRYALGDRDDLKFNADGSLDVYIQPDPPDETKAANWLPSAELGRVSLMLRLYEPRPAALNGEWVPPVVRRTE